MTTRVAGILDPCPVDVDVWQKANRIQLAPDHKFRWVLVRTDRDNPSTYDITTTANAVMAKWFGDVHPATPTPIADVLSVRQLSGPYVPDTTAIRREQLPGPPPTIEVVKLPIYVVVEFAYRGSTTRDMPWPTRKGGMVQLKSTAACPDKADWMLQESVDMGPADPPVPILERMGKAIAEGAEEVARGAAKGIGWGVVGAAAIAIGVIWLTSRRKAD